jgi:hypothetical protein
LIVETGAAIWNLEKVILSNGLHPELCISGWFCPKPADTVVELAILVDGESFPCLAALPRPDVAAYFGTSDYSPTGFVVRLPAHVGKIGIQMTTASGQMNTFDHEICAQDIQTESGAAGSYLDWLAHIEHASSHFYPLETSSLGQVKISVILPTYNTPLYYLDRCIRSVVRQVYPFWELCIADDGSTDARVLRELKAWASRDRRIGVTFRENQGGISAASNSAIDQATGEFILLLDHDDELHPWACAEIAARLASVPDADVIYSDEDKIDDHGLRTQPVFKPNFDPDLLASYDYVGHLVCIRKARVIEVGGFRPEFDGAQDWDMLFRVTERCEPNRIQHVPTPLYHWRMHGGSTALNLDAKPYVFGAWTKVLNDHIHRQNIPAEVEPGLFLGSMRLRRRVPADIRIAVLYRASDGPYQERAVRRIPIPQQTCFYEIFLSAIRKARPVPAEQTLLLTMEDLQADVLVFLNCSLETVNHGFMEELVGQALRDDCALVSGVVTDRHGLIVSCGLAFGRSDDLMNPFRGLSLSATGYMGLTKVVRSVPGFEPYYFAVRSDFARLAFCLSNISEDSLDSISTRLIRMSHSAERKVLVTPYAVATLQYHSDRPTAAFAARSSSDLRLNKNLEDFGEATGVLKRGVL